MRDNGRADNNSMSKVANEELWPGIDSRFTLVVVAALRSKQLLQGARPRIVSENRKARNTSIALEEIRLGLVPFSFPPTAVQEVEPIAASAADR
jgi:DNA-directed RNA polymerase omega subunit